MIDDIVSEDVRRIVNEMNDVFPGGKDVLFIRRGPGAPTFVS